MREQAEKYLFEYLLNISNGNLLLNTKQLEKVINISSKQQSILRKNNKFPIKYKTIGRLVYYPISSVIDYLMNGEQGEHIEKHEVKETTIKKKSVRQSKNTEDLSYLFNLRAFSNNINKEFERVSFLHDFFNKFVTIKEDYIRLNQSLCSKKTTQKD